MVIKSPFDLKRQKYLAPLLILIVIVIIFFGLYNFLVKPRQPTVEVPPPREIKINFQVLENPILKEWEVFEEISSFQGEIGRENPFTPY